MGLNLHIILFNKFFIQKKEKFPFISPMLDIAVDEYMEMWDIFKESESFEPLPLPLYLPYQDPSWNQEEDFEDDFQTGDFWREGLYYTTCKKIADLLEAKAKKHGLITYDHMFFELTKDGLEHPTLSEEQAQKNLDDFLKKCEEIRQFDPLCYAIIYGK